MMTSAAPVVRYEVWTRDQPLRLFVSSDDDPRPNPTTHFVGTYDTVEAATAAAKETGASPLCYIDAAHDLSDVTYAGAFVLTVKRDAARGCQIFDRR